MSSVAAPSPGSCTSLIELDTITDEERLRCMWQQAEDFGERRRIRARMYKLKEQRLREMMQNDEESLGALSVTDEGGLSGGEDMASPTPVRRASNIQVTMHVEGDKAVTDSISTQNVRLGGLTLRGVEGVEGVSAEQMIAEQMRQANEDRSGRYQRILGELSDGEGDAVLSITKNTYSIQSNALAGEGYISLKNKEVRDSVSPTRIIRERRSSAEDETSATEGRLTSDDEAALRTESENVIQELNKSRTTTSTTTTTSSRKTSREEKSSTSTRASRGRQSEIPVPRETSRKVSERKLSKELDLSSNKRGGGSEKSSPTSPSRRTPGDSSPRGHGSRKTGAQREVPSPGSGPSSPNKSPTRAPTAKATTTTTTTTTTTANKKAEQLADIESKMEASIMSELDKLDTYLSGGGDDQDEVVMEHEEDVVDEDGHVVRMLVQTRRRKDGSECTARRVARSTKLVDTEGEIDEILIGNPDHEVLQRDVSEEEDEEGNKIKIITETRRRPDGITYTTKNVLKTSKIFDYDHPEDVAYNEDDQLISSNETEETDEHGATIRTVTETRRKKNGVEYTTKKVYKTCKVKTTRITPSDDDEVLDTRETEEKAEDGSTVRTVIETRRTKGGEEYTHRQVFRSRRMTLSAVEVQRGLPAMDNDDEVVDREEKEEPDETGRTVRVVTETRRRPDGSTYSFEYVIRSFQGTQDEVNKMPVGSGGSSGIAVCAEDELLKEDVKEEVLEDGTTVKTIVERRRAKDGTEYLRHRILRIPRMPEPVLQVARPEDEVLQEEVKEETLQDGSHRRAVTERRRSSVSGLQYTLRRTSRVYHPHTVHPHAVGHEILDENETEEETDDGTLVRTVSQRVQRPDGSVYTTQHVQRTFTTPTPITITGTDNDELLDRREDEHRDEDGAVVRTVVETRRRADGVQYTVERAERTAQRGHEVQVTLSTGSQGPKRPEEVVVVGSPEDTVVSTEEHEEEEEDGSVVRTVVEVRRRTDGTEYTCKTILRSAPVLVPERETSFVVIRPEGGDDDDDTSFFPSPDDEVLLTRQKEEPGPDGRPVPVVVETRLSRTTGERYNVTKRVHTTDVLLTETGETQLPRGLVKTTLLANVTAPSATPVTPATTKTTSATVKTTYKPSPDKPTNARTTPATPRATPKTTTTPKATPTTPKATPATPATPKATPATPKATPATPRATPATPRATPATPRATPATPRTAPISSATPSSPRASPASPASPASRSPERRPTEPEQQEEPDHIPYGSVSALKNRFAPGSGGAPRPDGTEPRPSSRPDRTNTLNKKRFFEDAAKAAGESPASPKMAPRRPHSPVEKEQPREETPEDIDEEIARLEEKEAQRHQQKEEPQSETEEEPEMEEEEEPSSPSDEEPQEAPARRTEPVRKTPGTRPGQRPKKVAEETPRKRREISPRKVEEQPRRGPVSGRKVPSQDDSPTRKTPSQRRQTKTSPTSPQRGPTSPQRGPTSPQRGPTSPQRGPTSPQRGPTSPQRAPSSPERRSREVTPTGRGCCKKHPEEPTSPTRTPTKTTGRPSSPRKAGSPESKPRINGESPRTPADTRINGERGPRGRRPAERPTEPERTTTRPSRLSQTPRKATPSTRSPDKREPTTRPTTTRPADRKGVTKPAERTPKTRQPEGKATLAVPEDKSPVITLPETPMTEDMKPLPTEESDGPDIEDVSATPDLPYHTVHRPSLVREPSEYPEAPSDSSPEEPEDTEPRDRRPEKKSPRKAPETPAKDEPSRTRKTRPLESRLSDKSLTSKDKKTPQEPRRATRDRPWLTEKKNSFERKPSEPKMTSRTPEKKRPAERRPSDEAPAAVQPREEAPEEPQTVTPDEEPEAPQPASPSPSEDTPQESPRDKIVEQPQQPQPQQPQPQPQQPQQQPSSRFPRDVDRSPAPTRTITTSSSVAAKRSLFNRGGTQPEAPSPNTRPDRPGRKPSFEMKESVFSRRSLFEQTKTEASPEPVRRPLFKTPLRKEPQHPQEEPRQPVKEEPVKESPRQLLKETPDKEEPRQPRKDSLKEEPRQPRKDSPKEEPRQPRKDSPKEEPKQPRKDSVKDEPRQPRKDSLKEEPRQPRKDSPKEEPRQPRKDSVKEEPRQPRKDSLKDEPRQPVKEEPRQPRKESLKESPRQAPKDTRQPVVEPVIVPKYIHPLGGDEDTRDSLAITSSSLVRTAMASTRKRTSPTQSPTRSSPTHSPTRSSPSHSPTRVPNKERSPSPTFPRSKEGSPAPRHSKETSPAPFTKESSPTRFVTGKPVDSGVDLTKLRRIERAASNKKLLEDLEVPKDSLPNYLNSIDTIFDVAILESMLEKAVSYEERRIIRGQLRIAKRPGSHRPTTTTTTTTSRITTTTTTKKPLESTRTPTDTDKKPSEPTTRKVSKPQEPTRRTVETSIGRKVSEAKISLETTSTSTRKVSEPKEPLEPIRKTSVENIISRKVSEAKISLETTSSRKVSDPKKPSDEPIRKVSEAKITIEPLRRPSDTKISPSIAPDSSPSSRASPPREARPEEPLKEPNEPQFTTVKTEEPRKTELQTKTSYRFGGKRTPVQPAPQPATPSNEPYIEPLRYQKSQSGTPSKPASQQSDVDKIVSAYGVGPTDEFGVPLFGLQALKRRTPATTEPAPEPQQETPKEEEPYVPKDALGRPLFGLRSLRRANQDTTTSVTSDSATTTSTTTTTSSSSRHTTTASVDRRGKTSPRNIIPKDESSEEEVEEEEEEEEVEEDSSSSSSDEEETSPRLVRGTRDAIKRKEEEAERKREKRVSAKPTTTTTTTTTLSTRATDSPTEVIDTEDTTSNRSWRQKAEYSTTTTTVSTTSTTEKPKVERKLTGILKKTSTSSLLGDSKDDRTADQVVSTDELLNTLTDDQISRLSHEFDLRAQEDGVIKTEESVEDVEGGYRITSRTTGEAPGCKFARKTSYTEIKLQPSEGGHHVTSSSSATVQSSSTSFHTSSRDDEMKDGKSFLDDRSKVTGITDVLSRMGATEAVDHEAKVTSDEQARSLLNRFLGAQVLMSGVESMMASSSMSEAARMETDSEGKTTVTKTASGHAMSAGSKDGEVTHHHQASFTTQPITTTTTTKAIKGEPVVVCGVDINEVSDTDRLNQLLDTCGEYEDRRRIRMRIKSLMVDRKGDKTTVSPFGASTDMRGSTQGSFSQKSYSSSYSTSSSSSSRAANYSTDKSKTVSPFEKFKKLDSQQSPRTTNGKGGPGAGGVGAPLFQLSSQLTRSASGVKDLLLNWCQCRTRDYQGVKIENFSTSWNDGLAFCALVHHFYPDAFDFDKLSPKNRRHNFELAFRVADERAGVMPLLDVEDMVMMKKPDWKCVFTYVQALYKRFKDE